MRFSQLFLYCCLCVTSVCIALFYLDALACKSTLSDATKHDIMFFLNFQKSVRAVIRQVIRLIYNTHRQFIEELTSVLVLTFLCVSLES